MQDRNEICIENLNELLIKYKGFLIKTVSDMLGRYVSVENDDEYSVALAGFVEAVERFDKERGAFTSYAKLVIQSRIKNYWEKNKEWANVTSLEEMRESGKDFAQEEEEDSTDLNEEIERFKHELGIFGLTLEILADHAPKHRDTRKTAIGIAKKAGHEESLVQKTYEKKRLPVRAVASFCEVSEKTVKGSRFFILGGMIIFVKRFLMLSQWLKMERC